MSFIQHRVWKFAQWDKFAILWQLFNGAAAYLTIVSSVYVKQTGENLRIEERRNAELQIRAGRAEAARASAELAALRDRLNPHFLFNTLHSLMALVRSNTETAEEAIERLALMLRYVLQSQDEKQTDQTDVTFAEEWNFVCNYLELERLRLGDRLRLTTEIEPAALLYHLPAFSLQPIVENAVKHAIAPRARGGQIRVTARSEKENLIIEVSDDGTCKSTGNEQNNNGLGLRLVRESLAARFGAAACLTTKTKPNEGFKVTMMIPRTNPPDKDSGFSENGGQNL
jgi:LytS/YehU family sensor histidine kinase